MLVPGGTRILLPFGRCNTSSCILGGTAPVCPSRHALVRLSSVRARSEGSGSDPGSSFEAIVSIEWFDAYEWCAVHALGRRQVEDAGWSSNLCSSSTHGHIRGNCGARRSAGPKAQSVRGAQTCWCWYSCADRDCTGADERRLCV
jgi:hypothetical protein